MATTKNEDLCNSSISNENKISASTSTTTGNINSTTTASSSSDRCYRCQKRVYVTERMGPIKGSLYHKLCFKCSKCDRRLELKTYFTNPVNLNDTNIYCQKHVPRSDRHTFGTDNIQIQNPMELQQMFGQGPKAVLPTNDSSDMLLPMSNELSNQPPSFGETENDINSTDTKMKKQNELKAYYDNFPDIIEVTNDTGSDIEKAKELTESIMKELPSGDVNDRETICHILNNLLGDENEECLFYDSAKGINLHDASGNLTDIDVEDKPFVLKLNNSNGLGDDKNEKIEEDDLQLVDIINDAIKQEESHPIIEDILERLSKAHDIDKNYIKITRVYYGTFNIVYTIKDLGKRFKKTLEKIGDNLKTQFKEFVSAKIHPLLYRPSFDIGYFDGRGNKTFSSESETYQIGPSERTQLYTLPYEWTRYGLKVLGKYSNDYWLHPFQDPRNWYRAFHGTGNANPVDFNGSGVNFDKQYASVDALASIFKTEFRTARTAVHGPGVYCSPNPKFPEGGYTTNIQLNTKKGKRMFKCMLQVAVNPDGVKFATNDIWVVADPKDIRPYGILIKEIN